MHCNLFYSYFPGADYIRGFFILFSSFSAGGESSMTLITFLIATEVGKLSGYMDKCFFPTAMIFSDRGAGVRRVRGGAHSCIGCGFRKLDGA